MASYSASIVTFGTLSIKLHGSTMAHHIKSAVNKNMLSKVVCKVNATLLITTLWSRHHHYAFYVSLSIPCINYWMWHWSRELVCIFCLSWINVAVSAVHTSFRPTVSAAVLGPPSASTTNNSNSDSGQRHLSEVPNPSHLSEIPSHKDNQSHT